MLGVVRILGQSRPCRTVLLVPSRASVAFLYSRVGPALGLLMLFVNAASRLVIASLHASVACMLVVAFGVAAACRNRTVGVDFRVERGAPIILLFVYV